MNLNKKQKRILITGLLLSLAAMVIWFKSGAEIFTKTEVLVDKQDPLLGATFKEWENKFVLGLDYTLGFIGIVFATGSFIVWKIRTKVKN